MNQIFNISRFFKLTAYHFKTNQKRLLLMLGGAFAAMFLLFLIILLGNSRWDVEDWSGLFLGLGITGFILYTGFSFSSFRKKEPTIKYLMLPVSNFEKFLFEFVNRFILYLIIFPLVYLIASHFAAFFANVISDEVVHSGYNLIDGFKLTKHAPGKLIAVLSLLILWGASVGFAGAASFRKLPLIKTIALIAGLFMLVTGYFFILIQVFDLEGGLAYTSKHYINSETVGANLFIAKAVVSILVTLAFAFFKLREKEVA